MAENENVNKVVYGNQTLIDITDTTADDESVADGEVFYKASGARSTGTMQYVKTITFNGAINSPDGNKDISLTETDPTVPSWAKQSVKPSYTANEVGALANPVLCSGVDLKKSDNDVESQVSFRHRFIDKNSMALGEYYVTASPNGDTDLRLYVGNGSTTANVTYAGGIRIIMAKNSGGEVSYNITSKANFRDAISVYSKDEVDSKVATLTETKSYLGIS